MASGSVTASTEADIISDMLKKPFSARQSGEQNIIVTYTTANAEFTIDHWR
jgi:hypothetical protein